MRTGDGFVIIYSITDKKSFTEAEAIFNWLKRLKQADPHAVSVIVSNIKLSPSFLMHQFEKSLKRFVKIVSIKK